MREVVFLRQRSKLLTALDRVREEVDDLVQIVVEALRPGAEVDGLFEGEGVFGLFCIGLAWGYQRYFEKG